jgi:hypothetical protein
MARAELQLKAMRRSKILLGFLKQADGSMAFDNSDKIANKYYLK